MHACTHAHTNTHRLMPRHKAAQSPQQIHSWNWSTEKLVKHSGAAHGHFSVETPDKGPYSSVKPCIFPVLLCFPLWHCGWAPASEAWNFHGSLVRGRELDPNVETWSGAELALLAEQIPSTENEQASAFSPPKLGPNMGPAHFRGRENPESWRCFWTWFLHKNG